MVVGKIETYPLENLLKVYDAQIENRGSKEYIEIVKNEIKNRVFANPSSRLFRGQGCCSEYRNSIRFQFEEVKNIIQDILTEEESNVLDNIYKQIQEI